MSGITSPFRPAKGARANEVTRAGYARGDGVNAHPPTWERAGLRKIPSPLMGEG